MNGQMMNYRNYYEHLKIMPEPIMPSELPNVKIDYDGLIRYAKNKGVEVMQLSEGEKEKFVTYL